MKVAYVCADPGVPVFGSKGASVHVREVLRALVRCGARVDLFAVRLGGEVPAGLESVRVHHIRVLDSGGSRETSVRAAAAEIAAVLAGQDYDLLYERYSLWSCEALAVAGDTGTPSVLEVNAPLIDEHEEHRGLLDRAAAEAIAGRAFRSASAMFAVSDAVAAWVRGFAGVGGLDVRVVPNAVDVSRFSPRTARQDGPVVVGFLGTLKPWHGLDVLLEAFAHARRSEDLRLLVIGDGPERRKLEGDAARWGLADVATFTGAVDPDDVPNWLQRVDIAVAPYPAIDGFYFSPMKLFEYLAAALPVVASGIGQVSDLIQDGRTGILCRPGDPAGLSDALVSLARDPMRRAELGSAGRAMVARDHSWDSVALLALGLTRSPVVA